MQAGAASGGVPAQSNWRVKREKMLSFAIRKKGKKRRRAGPTGESGGRSRAAKRASLSKIKAPAPPEKSASHSEHRSSAGSDYFVGMNEVLGIKKAVAAIGDAEKKQNFIEKEIAAAKKSIDPENSRHLFTPQQLFDWMKENDRLHTRARFAELFGAKKMHWLRYKFTSDQDFEPKMARYLLQINLAKRSTNLPHHQYMFSEGAFAVDKLADLKSSFTLHLYQTGFSLNSKDKHFQKYDKKHVALLRSIDNGEIPSFVHNLLQQLPRVQYYNGCLLADIKDYRHINRWSKKPKTSRVLLRPTGYTLSSDALALAAQYKAVKSREGGRMDEETFLKMCHIFEEKLLVASGPLVCFEPSPRVMQAATLANYNKKMNIARRLDRREMRAGTNAKRRRPRFRHVVNAYVEDENGHVLRSTTGSKIISHVNSGASGSARVTASTAGEASSGSGLAGSSADSEKDTSSLGDLPGVVSEESSPRSAGAMDVVGGSGAEGSVSASASTLGSSLDFGKSKKEEQVPANANGSEEKAAAAGDSNDNNSDNKADIDDKGRPKKSEKEPLFSPRQRGANIPSQKTVKSIKKMQNNVERMAGLGLGRGEFSRQLFRHASFVHFTKAERPAYLHGLLLRDPVMKSTLLGGTKSSSKSSSRSKADKSSSSKTASSSNNNSNQESSRSASASASASSGGGASGSGSAARGSAGTEASVSAPSKRNWRGRASAEKGQASTKSTSRQSVKAHAQAPKVPVVARGSIEQQNDAVMKRRYASQLKQAKQSQKSAQAQAQAFNLTAASSHVPSATDFAQQSRTMQTANQVNPTTTRNQAVNLGVNVPMPGVARGSAAAAVHNSAMYKAAVQQGRVAAAQRGIVPNANARQQPSALLTGTPSVTNLTGMAEAPKAQQLLNAAYNNLIKMSPTMLRQHQAALTRAALLLQQQNLQAAALAGGSMSGALQQLQQQYLLAAQMTYRNQQLLNNKNINNQMMNGANGGKPK